MRRHKKQVVYLHIFVILCAQDVLFRFSPSKIGCIFATKGSDVRRTAILLFRYPLGASARDTRTRRPFTFVALSASTSAATASRGTATSA